jgi:3',5'-cyclic AMP phosphodiesterase CpdA
MMISWRKPLEILLTLALLLGAVPAFANDATILARDAAWKFHDQGKLEGDAWKTADFDDSAWKSGAAPLGFGDDYSETDPSLPIGTVIGFGDDAANKYMTSYFRTTVEVGDLSAYTGLEVYIHVDDGCVVYVNGVEAFRRGIADGPVSYDTAAKFKPKEETFTAPVSLFAPGKNVIAAEVHQDGGDSSDLWFELGVKGMTGEAAPAAAPAVTVPTPPRRWARFSKLTVTFAGDTMTAKGFTWYTTAASAGSDVQVVEKARGEPDFMNAMKFSGRWQLSTNSAAEVVHKAEAVGLKPDTSYFFRVGDEALGLWSGVGSFETAADGAFTFIDLADPQAKKEDEAVLSAHTFKKAVETVKGAKFMVLNGDIVDTGLNEGQWDWLLGHSKDTLMNLTIAPIAGNHEEDKNSFFEHFDVFPAPFSPTESGAYYSFDYANAHFIMLNTNEDSKAYADFTPAQIQWLKGDAAAAKAAGAQWLIAVLHKGPYTTSNHAEDADIMGENGVRALVAPLFNQIGVDLVLQGHDHIYARSKPIADGAAVEAQTTAETLNGMPIEYAVKPEGTVYVIPATAGPKVYYKSAKMPAEYYDLFAVADENHAAPYGADPDDASRPVRGAIQTSWASPSTAPS